MVALGTQFTEIHFYVLLTIGSLQLLLDEHDIRSVEVIEDVQTQLESGEELAGVIGWLAYGEDQYPVFSLSEDLNLLQQLPPKRRFCVLIQTEGEEAIFGIVCDAFEQLELHQNLRLQAIPASMHLSISPLSQLGIYNKSVACVTSAEALVGYISAWGEARMMELEAQQEETEPA